MEAIIPNKLKLLGTNAPADGYPVWSVDVAFAKGDKVLYDDNYIYESLKDDNLGNNPDETSAGTDAAWLRVVPENQWAALDGVNHTQTIAAEGQTDMYIEVPYNPPASGFGLLEMDVTQFSATITVPGNPDNPDAPGEVIWESGLVRMLEPVISIYHYLFDPFRYKRKYVTLNTPRRKGVLRIDMHGARPAIGTIIIGEVAPMGGTQWPPSFPYKDYSLSYADDYGNPVYIERKKAQLLTLTSFIEEREINYVHLRVMDVGGRPTLWIGDDCRGLQPLIVYGRIKQYDPVLVAPGVVRATFDIEGFI